MKEFVRKHITGKYKDKMIIMDNASSHRNEKNKLLYSIPYQPYTNAIENFFSVLKSKLQKMKGLKYEELKKNIEKAIKKIPSEKYKRIIEGTYRREGNKYEKKESTRKKELKKFKIGVLNVQRCNNFDPVRRFF